MSELAKIPASRILITDLEREISGQTVLVFELASVMAQICRDDYLPGRLPQAIEQTRRFLAELETLRDLQTRAEAEGE